MNKRKQIPILTVGGSSILTIFAVLCLVVFALLALSTARTNANLSQKSADSVKAYYQADGEAEEIFASIRQGIIPEGVTVSNQIYSYQCDMTDTQALKVRIKKTEKGFLVLEWKKVYTGQWEPDDSLKVWDGSTKDN